VALADQRCADTDVAIDRHLGEKAHRHLGGDGRHAMGKQTVDHRRVEQR
jgi:hypothetical protein